MNKYKFYKEKSTGKCIPSIEALSIDNYIEIKANTTDAALEKHVPEYEIKDNEISVTVGSIEHPMTNDHYIMWIALVKDDKITLKELTPNDKPTAIFEYEKDSEIYAYCNLHGLWKKDIE